MSNAQIYRSVGDVQGALAGDWSRPTQSTTAPQPLRPSAPLIRSAQRLRPTHNPQHAAPRPAPTHPTCSAGVTPAFRCRYQPPAPLTPVMPWGGGGSGGLAGRQEAVSTGRQLTGAHVRVAGWRAARCGHACGHV